MSSSHCRRYSCEESQEGCETESESERGRTAMGLTLGRRRQLLGRGATGWPARERASQRPCAAASVETRMDKAKTTNPGNLACDSNLGYRGISVD
eukprot:2915682-Pleurochrysis_carterae.AAC.1